MSPERAIPLPLSVWQDPQGDILLFRGARDWKWLNQ